MRRLGGKNALHLMKGALADISSKDGEGEGEGEGEGVVDWES